jgi:hypothetical protein
MKINGNIKSFLIISLMITCSCLIMLYITACDKNNTSPSATIATLTTLEVTDITQISATCGGYITDDGGSAVTSRGICWSGAQNPSIANNKTLDGQGTGKFISIIKGLLPNTKYFVRAYAINSSGTAYGDQVTFTTSLTPVNTIQLRLDGGETPKQIFDSGIPLDSLYGKTYQGGLIFYLNTFNGNGFVAAPTNQGSSLQWGCYGTPINGADSTAIGYGEQNTVDIDAGCPTSNIAADICINLELNNYSTWFLPSKDELNLIYTNLVLKGFGGFSSSVYWCSSEFSNNNAWEQNFSDGSQITGNKSNICYVRAIHAF